MSDEFDLRGGPFIRDDDEGLFSRDFNGQLIRMDAPTEEQYGRNVTIEIDGQAVTVPLARPLEDAAGNIVLDVDGRTTPRYSTIFDAVTQLYVKEPGDEAKIPIPTLCHQPHMPPVAVCRLCVVQIYSKRGDKLRAERRLLPACQHNVNDGMKVVTMNEPGEAGQKVRRSVKILTELLAADHLRPVASEQLAKELSPFDELGLMAKRCEADPERLRMKVLADVPKIKPPPVGKRGFDASSPVFTVNHDACILCDRCVRACDQIVKHHVIGRTGKGASAGIGFDLNDPMGDSSCVKCGECMVSCPTSAIVFKPSAQVMPSTVRRFSDVVTPAELMQEPAFAGIPPKFLLWQRGLVIRRRFGSGKVIFRQGEPGNTAFLIRSGQLRVTSQQQGAFGRLFGKPLMKVDLTSDDLIVGEMACLSSSPRTATLRGIKRGELWELRRNVLDRLMRLPSHREKLESAYRKRALVHVLQRADLFQDIKPAEMAKIVEYLRDRITFMRVTPRQTIFSQGDMADDVYLVRLGFVRVGVKQAGGEVKAISRGPGTILGEIGVLGLTRKEAELPFEDVDRIIREALKKNEGDPGGTLPPGVRTATLSALNHLELARLSRADVLRMARDFPIIRQRLVRHSLNTLRSDAERSPLLREFIDQGLYEGQSLLVLDLDLCTRCDECTKACVQQHGSESHGAPITRLLRDGLHFANYMVATACRSCTDAHCMEGCPVDSIHRGRHGQIVIEDHCIGCGLCASNCPYGNIFMQPNQKRVLETPDPVRMGKMRKITPLKASTCDLCDVEGLLDTPYPRCVAACPHEAAQRMRGDELFKRVSS